MTNEADKPPAYVAFQGGGMLGMAHLGAWQEISKHFEIVGVAGTSSGSIIAALCAAGFSPEEFAAKKEIDWADFVNGKSTLRLLVESIIRGLFGLGACSDGKRFYKWFDAKLKERHPDIPNCTFAELYQQNKTYLEVIACNLKDPDRSPISFSTDELGHTRISDAVRASISIPVIFEPVSIGDLELVDGGFKVNFPIERLYAKAKKRNSTLIGIRFKNPQVYLNPLNSMHVLFRTFKLIMSSGNKIPSEIERYSNYVDIVIDASGFNPLNFKMSESKKKKLFEKGKYIAKQQLEEILQRLKELKAELRSQLSPDIREIVDEARSWLNEEAQNAVRDYCKDVLNLERFQHLRLNLDENKIGRFQREIRNYLIRISESLLDQTYVLLEDRLLPPSMSNLEVYLEVLEHIKSFIPQYMSLRARTQIEERIDYLKKTVSERFDTHNH